MVHNYAHIKHTQAAGKCNQSLQERERDREQSRLTQTNRNSSSSQLMQQQRIESQRNIETQTFKKIALKQFDESKIYRSQVIMKQNALTESHTWLNHGVGENQDGVERNTRRE